MSINLLRRPINVKTPATITLATHFLYYPTPSSLNYNWSFGSLAGLFFALQIATGIFLAMYYTANVDLAFIFHGLAESDLTCAIYGLLILIFTACASAVGLGLLVTLYRFGRTIGFDALTSLFLSFPRPTSRAPTKSGFQLLLVVTTTDVRKFFTWLITFFDRYEWIFLNTLYCFLAAWFICYVLRIFVRSRHRFLYVCSAIVCLKLCVVSAVCAARAVTCFLAKNNPVVVRDESRYLLTEIYPSLASQYDTLTTLSQISACLFLLSLLMICLYFVAPLLAYDIWVELTILRALEAAGLEINTIWLWFLTCAARFLEIIRVKAGRVPVVLIACAMLFSMGMGYWVGLLLICDKLNYKANLWSLIFLDYKTWDPVPLAEVLSLNAPLIATVVTILVLLILERLWTDKDD